MVQCCCWKCACAYGRIKSSKHWLSIGNEFILLLEGKLACVIFPSWWNVVVDNVFVPFQEGKYIRH
jgi:uncharacterized cupin superfamily protein